ncbi:DUF6204 family protein [Glycomyces terrestris]|uniref:Uncharacterized protein n=1 Tax=Glycomyces terrestris TaxID=2493553 RepID=A0A426UXU6_9ACTN|nr:DUF6204 family protein [Glycomyces terrestris]RRR99397.1 hypothetical protein EIW28_11835 [Glycomyces terrestris]
MSRTYRATVRGRFEDLTAAQRERLRAEQGDHDMFASRFTPEGTFTYAPELVGYQFRYLIEAEEASPEDADLAAHLEAEQRAGDDLRDRGLSGRIVDVGLVCVEDLKLRAARRRR